MFCPECGVEGAGKFCVECGTRLSKKNESQHSEPARDLLTGDWTAELHYERLIRYPYVRDQITLAGQARPNRVSGEQLLKLYDTVASPGVSLEKLSVAILPILEGFGLKAGSEIEYRVRVAPGRLLLATICALASGGYDIENVDQLSKGCIITAFLPSTLITNRGKLALTIVQQTDSTPTQDDAADSSTSQEAGEAPLMELKAAAKISGQIVDWGKGKRILAALQESIVSHAELRGHAVAVAPAAPEVAGSSQQPESRCPQPSSPPPLDIPEPKTLEQLEANRRLIPPPIRRDVA